MTNFDEKTGIRYGVISPHAVSSEALDDVYQNGTDPAYEYGQQEILNEIKTLCEDNGLNFDRIDTDSFIDEYSNHFEGSGDGQTDYSDSEYTLHVSGDNFGIFVMKSPYYTYTHNCSPCAPGAGDLNNPIDVDGAGGKSEPSPYQLFASSCTEKTYCLGPEWFDKETREYSRNIPYRVFRVDDNSEVLPVKE